MDKKIAWNLAFFIGGGFMTVAAVFFVIFATATPQTWGLAKSRYQNALSAVMAGQRAPRTAKQHNPLAFTRYSIAY